MNKSAEVTLVKLFDALQHCWSTLLIQTMLRIGRDPRRDRCLAAIGLYHLQRNEEYDYSSSKSLFFLQLHQKH